MSARTTALLALMMIAGFTACGRTTSPAPPAPVPAPHRPTPPSIPSAPPAPPPRRNYASVRLALVGDINLGTLSLPNGVPPDSGRGLFDAARPALSGDLVIGNFEGTLGDSGVTYKCGKAPKRLGFHSVTDSTTDRRRERRRKPPKPPKPLGAPNPMAPKAPGCYAFLTPVALAPRLAEAGFTHLNLANNHANDFGSEGRATTDSVLRALGIRLYGPLGRVDVDTIRKGDATTVVGLIGFATYDFAYDLLDIERSAAVVDSVRRTVDLLVVTFHGGAEGVTALHTPDGADSLGHEQRGELRRWARAVIESGADAVVGHGPHVLRGIEFYKGVPIVYSLGNFLTYGGFSLGGPLGLTGVLQLDFTRGRRLEAARLLPMVQRAHRGPTPDATGGSLRMIRQLTAEDFPGSGAIIGDDGTISERP